MLFYQDLLRASLGVTGLVRELGLPLSITELVVRQCCCCCC